MRATTFAAILTAAAFGTPALAANPASHGEVFFAFDSAAPSAGRAAIDQMARAARAKPESRIVLDAHCDPIGTAPYNVRLAIRRAEAVRSVLIDDGIEESRIVLSVYGEGGAKRATHAADRRVGITLTRDSIASVIDTTFSGRGTAVTWDKPMSTAQIEAPVNPSVARR